MKLAISSESTCDLNQDYLEKNDIKIIPLAIHFDTEEHLDGVDIFPKDIFERVNCGSNLPKTSARSVGDYINFFNEIKKSYDTILHIAFSSELSCSYQNAVLASKEVGGVYVIDSKSLSCGHGLVVDKAVRERNLSNDIHSIVEKVVQFVPKVSASFIINTMAYLNKGGRCSSLASFAGSLLKIKPSIKLKDGKMQIGKKYMGRINEEILKYVDDMLKEFPQFDKEQVYIAYSSNELIDLERVKEKLLSKGFKNVYMCPASCTISSHCGPNTLGIMFIKE